MDTQTIVASVLAIVNGAIAVPIVQLLKKWLGIEGGLKAYLLTFAEIAAITAGYLIFALKAFTWPVFLISTAYAFLQASKIFDDLKSAGRIVKTA
jgi:hypothetical protein